MLPDDALIQWHGAPTATQRPFQKADPAHGNLVAYLPQGDPYTGTFMVRRFTPSYLKAHI